MNTCEITFENGIPNVKTHPKLMREILVYTDFNIDQSLDIYGIIFESDFENLNIENPTLDNLLAFIEQDYIQESVLSKNDKIDLLNISLQSDYKDVSDIKEVLLDSLSENGLFKIDIDKLRETGLFSDSELLNLDKSENIQTLKNLYYKLNNTDESFEIITTNMLVEEGFIKKTNPDALLQASYDNYINAESTDDIIDIANEIGDDLIINNPQLVVTVLENISNKQSLVSYETDEYNGEPTVKYINNPLVRIEQTIDVDADYSSLINQIQFLRELPIETFVEELPILNIYNFNIEKQAVDLGIDVVGLSEVLQNKNYNDIMDYLDSLYNLLYDIETKNRDGIQESMVQYSDAYNNFFNNTPIPQTKTVDKIESQGVYLNMESNKTEEELFRENSIVRLKDNIYQKITDNNTLDSLYDIILDNPNLLPKDVFTVTVKDSNYDIVREELDQYISNESKRYLNPNSDIDTIKKLSAYKLILNIKPEYKPNIVRGVDNLNIEKFLITFNKEMLKSPVLEDIFFFSNRGLESKLEIGEYTNRLVKIELSEKNYNDLVMYSKLSNNESLSYFRNINNDKISQNHRDYYSNNINELPYYNGDYKIDNGYIIANSNNEFLNVNNELYEQVAPSIYAKVEVSNGRYLNNNLSKPKYMDSLNLDLENNKGAEKIKINKTNDIVDETIEFC